MKNSKMLIIAIPVNGNEATEILSTIICLTESIDGEIFDPQDALEDIYYGALNKSTEF